MNPLETAREATGRAWARSRRGTTRTALWVKDGISDSAGRARDRVGRLRTRPEPNESPERTGAASLLERARADQRVAIAWALAGIVLAAWIGWTIYVWTENGSAAGLGVLISWPVVFIAAGLVALPFVAAGLLVHRHRLAADGAPSPGAGDEQAPGEDGDDASDAPEAEAADEDEDDAADGDEAEAEDGDGDDAADGDEDEAKDDDGDDDAADDDEARSKTTDGEEAADAA